MGSQSEFGPKYWRLLRICMIAADGKTQTRQELRDEKTEAVNEKGRRLDRDNLSVNMFLDVIDLGLQDVWHLLENDSFVRFRCSKEFHDWSNNQMDNQSDEESCFKSIWGWFAHII